MITKRVLLTVGISALLFTGCSTPPSASSNVTETETNGYTQTAKTENASEGKATFHTSVSLAQSYGTVSELTYNSALVAEVKILGIDHIDTSIDSTFYKAIVQDVVKQKEVKIEKDATIILKQGGVETEEEKKGVVEVDREDPLMKVGEEYVLFLKKHPSVENTFYMTGSYQGKYKIQDNKVYSIDNDSGVQRNIKDKDLLEFKNSIKELKD
jgi:hypothetical protein